MQRSNSGLRSSIKRSSTHSLVQALHTVEADAASVVKEMRLEKDKTVLSEGLPSIWDEDEIQEEGDATAQSCPDRMVWLRFGSCLDYSFFELLRVIALADAVFVPVMLCLGRTTWLSNVANEVPTLCIVDAVVGIVYLLGFLRRLVTTSVDINIGREYVHFGDILKQETREASFSLDIFSMPGHFWFFPGCRQLVSFRLLRMWRFFPGNRSRAYQISTGKVKGVFQSVSELTIIIFLVAHWLGCVWYAAVLWELDDISQLYTINPNYFSKNIWDTYLTCLADGSAMIVGWTGPSAYRSDGFTVPETVFYIFAAPFAALFLAWVVGVFIIAMERAAESHQRQMRVLEDVSSVLISLGMPLATRLRAMQYYSYQILHHCDKEKYERFFTGLSAPLRVEVRMMMYEGLILNAPFLSDTSGELLMSLVMAFEEEVFSPGDLIVRKGEIGHELYFVQKGLCEVLADDQCTEVLAMKSVGEYFGEVSIIFDKPRTAWVKAVTFCRLVKLTREAFERADINQQLKSKLIHHVNAKGRHTVGLESPLSTPLLHDSSAPEDVTLPPPQKGRCSTSVTLDDVGYTLKELRDQVGSLALAVATMQMSLKPPTPSTSGAGSPGAASPGLRSVIASSTPGSRQQPSQGQGAVGPGNPPPIHSPTSSRNRPLAQRLTGNPVSPGRSRAQGGRANANAEFGR